MCPITFEVSFASVPPVGLVTTVSFDEVQAVISILAATATHLALVSKCVRIRMRGLVAGNVRGAFACRGTSFCGTRDPCHRGNGARDW